MRTLFKCITAASLITAALAITACQKDKDKPEDPLRVSTNVTTMALTPGPDFEFNLTVESVMPANGVKIFYSVKGEADNLIYPQAPPMETSAAVTTIRLRNLPRQKICVCNISVTSNGNNSNAAVTSFRLVYK